MSEAAGAAAGQRGHDWIRITGARRHNLKNLSLSLPKNKLTVITGVSGSGKSSLAFDTLYAEGQRRYVESLSAYARQFLERWEKPDVDAIEGLSPAIAIEQRTSAPNPRSTVATTTEIYDYVRVLYASCGQPHDPATGVPLQRHTIPQIAATLQALPEGTRLMILAPLPVAEIGDTGDLRPLLTRLQKAGFVRLRVDGTVHELESFAAEQASRETPWRFASGSPPPVEIVIDRLAIRPDDGDRLIDSVRTALRWSRDEVWALIDERSGEAPPGWREHRFTTAFLNGETGFRLAELTPRHFSFNSPLGACPDCQGLGVQLEADPDLLVPDRSLSLAEGAVKSWWSGNPTMLGIHKQELEALAAHFQVRRDAPFDSLPAAFRDALFHGTGTTAVKTGWKTSGTTRSLAKPFEGLVPQARRLYDASESEALKRHIARFMRGRTCPSCAGRRLRPEILAVTLTSRPLAPGFRNPPGPGETVAELSSHASTPARAERATEAFRNPPVSGGPKAIDQWCALSVTEARAWLAGLELTATQQLMADEPVKEISARLKFLEDVGLGYLTLDREVGTLSGGEAQRIRLATQIGSGLSGVLYVLDEPSIGLHQRDNERLIETLHRLRDLGNTVLVVEHDEETMRAADWLVDLGPGAGPHGGQLLAAGSPEAVARDPASLTGRFLSGELRVGSGARRRETLLSAGQLTVHDAAEHNLKKLTANFPVGLLTCVTGVSGSGKSTLVDDILRRALAQWFYHAKDVPGRHREITGLEHFDKLVVVDQDPIGRSPRSNPVTYLGVFTEIRKLFAALPVAKIRGFTAGTFSFNTKGGRCEACEGDGQIRIDMHFLADVFVTCEACGGRRYQRDVLDVTYKGRSIAQVLDMSFEEATAFFRAVPQVSEKLRTICLVGLGYLRLGQGANTLSGGEAQRLKLAAELAKRATGRTLYLLDEPTTGLHFQDIDVLLGVLFRLRDAGNTLIVIEHNLDVIRSADWVIDLGPGGGAAGGALVAEGTPEAIAACAASETGRFLRRWTAHSLTTPAS
ncbi:MAG: excinuclease ABC subunit UvrA [Verrucomicrobiales bacterium]